MSNSSYGDDLTPGILSYTMQLADDYQDSNISGGRYIYTNGSGPGGSAGTYAYEDGDFGVNDINWEVYFDHDITNQWNYPTHRPTLP